MKIQFAALVLLAVSSYGAPVTGNEGGAYVETIIEDTTTCPSDAQETVAEVHVASSCKLRTQSGTISLMESLGQGIGGQVFRAERLEEIAFKVFKVTEAEQKDEDKLSSKLMSIQKEAKIAFKAGLALVPTVEKYGEVYGLPMKLVPGKNAEAEILEMGPSVASKIEIYNSIKIAIKELHALGIIHGDAKPGNFIFKNGKSIAVDFGRSTLIGEPTFMITEQVTVGEYPLFGQEFLDQTALIGGLLLAIANLGPEREDYLAKYYEFAAMIVDDFKTHFAHEEDVSGLNNFGDCLYAMLGSKYLEAWRSRAEEP